MLVYNFVGCYGHLQHTAFAPGHGQYIDVYGEMHTLIGWLGWLRFPCGTRRRIVRLQGSR